MSTNCWEFKKCGMEKTDNCPAVTKRMGKACWMVAGTMCGGKVQGVFAEKIKNCTICDYYTHMKSKLGL